MAKALAASAWTRSLSERGSLSEKIVDFWMPHTQHHDASWQAHQNINDVVLVTASMPDIFLSVGA